MSKTFELIEPAAPSTTRSVIFFTHRHMTYLHKFTINVSMVPGHKDTAYVCVYDAQITFI